MFKGSLAALSVMLGLSTAPAIALPKDPGYGIHARGRKNKSSKRRKHMTFKNPDHWDFRGYAGDGMGFFKSRQTGCVEVKKIHVRNPSFHVQQLYGLNG